MMKKMKKRNEEKSEKKEWIKCISLKTEKAVNVKLKYKDLAKKR